MGAGHAAPACRVVVDGRDITSLIDPRLVRLTISESREDKADQLDLVISDSDGLVAMPKEGAQIEVEIGWRGQALTPKGRFKVDEVSHEGAPDRITVRARSADFTADFRIRRERGWRDTTLGAVIADIAAPHGLAAQVAPALAQIAVPVLAQSRESDAQLLARLGRKYDAASTVKAGRILFAKVGSGATATGKAIPAAAITRADGDRHRWQRVERDGGYTGVSARWHDTGGAKTRTVRAGKTGKVKSLARTYGSEGAAKQAAEAEWGRVQRLSATLSLGLALGRPDLYPERRVSVTGFKEEIDGSSWLIAGVNHTIDGQGGFTTALEMEAV